METFSALLALCAGNSPVPVNSPHKGQWRGALMFTLICAGINDWVNNREAGDLRRHLDHYDVSVMMSWQLHDEYQTQVHFKNTHTVCTSFYFVMFWFVLAHIPWWRHQMETFSALLALCAGNSPVTGEFPSQRPVTRSFQCFLWSAPE